MKVNKTRKCIVTGNILDAKKLVRVVRDKSGNFFVNSNVLGRGAYILCSLDVINELLRKRSLNKVFRTQIPNHVYEEVVLLITQMNGGDKNDE